MIDTIGVGLIGVGRMARSVASSVRMVPELELRAVSEIDGPKGQAFADEWGIAYYEDYECMLARDDISVAWVLLPHFLHHPAGMAAISADKHLFLEKPMACSVEECNQLVEAARTRGLRIMVGHHYHFTAPTRAARKLLQSGELGEPIMAMDIWHKPFFDQPRPPWFLDASKGGGAWPMNASHMIDRLMWCTGKRVESVLAQVGSPIFGMSATDSGISHLRFSDGFSATICHGAYREGVPRFETEFVCTDGMLKVNSSEVMIGRGGEYTAVELEPMNSQREQTAAFARALVDGTEVPTPGEYGREVVAVLEATEESTRRGCEVRVNELLSVEEGSSY